MKPIHYIICITASLIILTACESAGLVGSGMQPDGDKSVVYIDTFTLKASTVILDSIYAKSSYGMLGNIYDPTFGTFRSGYLCQFYTQDNFRFSKTPVNGKIDSMRILISYERNSWIGDTLAPMQMTVYPLIKQLKGHFYTNFDPKDYIDTQHPLTKLTYTPRDRTVSDSIWNLTGTYAYSPILRMKMPVEIGQAFYDATQNNPEVFKNQQTFNNFFPGVYIANTFGSGNIIVANNTWMLIYYQYALKSASGGDSTAMANEIFMVTEDVIQLNHFHNTDISHLLEQNDDFTYLKTPAGIYTRITIPVKEIFSKIKNRKINNAYFSLTAMPAEERPFTINTPSYLMILPEDSLANFFRQSKIDNTVTSIASMPKSSAALTYNFGNIASMLDYYMKNNPDMEELNLLVIPVERSVQTDNYGEATNISTAIGNYLRPSALKLRKDPPLMKFQVITSEYTK